MKKKLLAKEEVEKQFTLLLRKADFKVNIANAAKGSLTTLKELTKDSKEQTLEEFAKNVFSQGLDNQVHKDLAADLEARLIVSLTDAFMGLQLNNQKSDN